MNGSGFKEEKPVGSLPSATTRAVEPLAGVSAVTWPLDGRRRGADITQAQASNCCVFGTAVFWGRNQTRCAKFLVS